MSKIDKLLESVINEVQARKGAKDITGQYKVIVNNNGVKHTFVFDDKYKNFADNKSLDSLKKLMQQKFGNKIVDTIITKLKTIKNKEGAFSDNSTDINIDKNGFVTLDTSVNEEVKVMRTCSKTGKNFIVKSFDDTSTAKSFIKEKNASGKKYFIENINEAQVEFANKVVRVNGKEMDQKTFTASTIGKQVLDVFRNKKYNGLKFRDLYPDDAIPDITISATEMIIVPELGKFANKKVRIPL